MQFGNISDRWSNGFKIISYVGLRQSGMPHIQFAALEISDNNVEKNRASESIRENTKTSAKESYCYHT
jgi:hypothetical protein